MKIALFLYHVSDFDNISLSEDQKYTYEKLNRLGKKEGVLFIRSSILEYNNHTNSFRRFWEFNSIKGEWEVKKNVTPHMIIDKCVQTPETFALKKVINNKIPLLNNPYFTEICDNKILSYIALEEISPLTKIFTSKKDLLNDFKSEKVVLKPMYGSGGNGIKILDKKDLVFDDSYNDYIVQEFIETKNGIDDFNRRHDLRVVMLNNEIVHTYIRSPRTDNMLLSNVALGGEEIGMEISDLPANLVKIVSTINANFSKIFGKLFYTIDLLISDDKEVYVVEINSKPGIYKSEGEDNLKKLDYVLVKLITLCKDF